MKRVLGTAAIVAALMFGNISIAQDIEETPEPDAVMMDEGDTVPVEVVISEDELPTPDGFLAEVFDVLEEFVNVAKTASRAGLAFGFIATIMVSLMRWLDARFLGSKFTGEFWQTVVGLVIIVIYWIAQHFNAGNEFLNITAWLNEVGPKTIELLGVLGISGATYVLARKSNVLPFFSGLPSRQPEPQPNG